MVKSDHLKFCIQKNSACLSGQRLKLTDFCPNQTFILSFAKTRLLGPIDFLQK